MNRTQRAKIRAAREKLDMNRAFKNDALESRILHHGGFYPSNTDSRFQNEKNIFESSKKELRHLKKYNGPTGTMSESTYKEFMGA